jgi:hypothetical protein
VKNGKSKSEYPRIESPFNIHFSLFTVHPVVPGIPVLKPREVIALLTALGFVEVRQRGADAAHLPDLHFRAPNGLNS